MVRRIAVVAAAVAALSIPVSVSASTITSVSTFSLPGPSTGSIGPVGATPAPNNDNAAGTNPNVIPMTVFLNATGPIEVEFATADSGGTTEYRFLGAFIETRGVHWAGFDFELGFGTGVDFVPLAAAVGLDFDTPDLDAAPFMSAFPTIDTEFGRLHFSGGITPGVTAVAFGFSIDVPDGYSETDHFTLRATPVLVPVPEPGTLALLATALGGAALHRRRKTH